MVCGVSQCGWYMQRIVYASQPNFLQLFTYTDNYCTLTNFMYSEDAVFTPYTTEAELIILDAEELRSLDYSYSGEQFSHFPCQSQ